MTATVPEQLPAIWTTRNLTVLLGSTMTVMAGATISPALPAIEQAFASVPNAALLTQLALTIPGLFIAASAPVAGLLLDKYGRKPILLIALILYAVAGSSGYWLNSLYAILAGRSLLGIGVAGIMSGFSTLIADYFEGEGLDRFMGLQAAFTGFGGVVFVLLGGFLAERGWRMPFLIYLLSALVAIAVTLFILEPSTPKETSDSVAEPSFSFTPLLKIYALAFTGMLIFYLVPTQIPFYLTELGVGGAQTGIAISALTLMAAVASLQYRRLRQLATASSLFAFTFGLMAVGYAIIGLSGSYLWIIVGLLVAGLGLGLLQPNLATWLVPLVPPAGRGRAFGGLTTALFLGQFLSPIIFRPFGSEASAGFIYLVAVVPLLLLALLFILRRPAS